MAKKRFGVSIDSTLYSKLDALAKKLGTERSTVVEEAIKNYINDLDHLSREHHCCGLLIVEDPDIMAVEHILANYKDVILNYTHHHVGGRCICTIMVYGSASTVAKLYSQLSKVKSVNKRYIPLHND